MCMQDLLCTMETVHRRKHTLGLCLWFLLLCITYGHCSSRQGSIEGGSKR